MEVVAGGERAGGPFSRRNVQEWSRLDQLTGLLEHARVETDHWTASTSNSSHHFGKVVDSRSRNLADGGQEQRQQTKQLEVFQASLPGGSLQVIRSSTTSSWQTHKTLSGGSGWSVNDRLALPSSESQDFDHLKLALHPLDLSSQKTKASIGRSGSIGSRRPPSRPRSIAGLKTEEASEQPGGSRLSELSKLCQKVHEEAKKDVGNRYNNSPQNGFNCEQNDNTTNNASPLTQSIEKKIRIRNNVSRDATNPSSDSSSALANSHISVIRKKSCSSEDLHVVDEEESDKTSNISEWKRTSKVRRSLQFPPKPSSIHKESIVIPVTKSVAEIRKEIEARKQIVTNSIKANQWNNFAELEGVLGVAGNTNSSDQISPLSDTGTVSPTKSKKRQTFITAETLKEVRGRLRKLSSPIDEVLKIDDVDDGIDTEIKPLTPDKETPKSSVKSYVFGMEVMLRKSKPPIIGTGSLESRSSSKSVTNGSCRSEEWYNRRKSYGFEEVSNQQNSNPYFEKDKLESSTDSGICKSSDTFPSWPKLAEKPSLMNQNKTFHNISIKSYNDNDNQNSKDLDRDSVVQKGRKTVVNLVSNTSNVSSAWPWSSNSGGITSVKDESKDGVFKGRVSDTIKNFDKSISENQRLSEPITISIPISQQITKSSSADAKDLLLKQTKAQNEVEPTNSSSNRETLYYSGLLFGKERESTPETKSIFDNIPWRGNRTKTLSNFFDSEFKRHSIAVDQTKYLNNKKPYISYHLNSVNNKRAEFYPQDYDVYGVTDKESFKGNADSDHEQAAQEKKQKKVEFCKTEVHFAAEPGRFNIVETDGKPPPTNMYRRKRKTSPDTLNNNRSGLPEIRFGDTQYEQLLLTAAETSSTEESSSVKPLSIRSSPLFHDGEKDSTVAGNINTRVPQSKYKSLVIENENGHSMSDLQNSSEDETPKPRSILKNNIPKPKPYLLGEVPENFSSEENAMWGVKLKSVLKPESETQQQQQPDSQLPKQTEFQKLLKSLRPAVNRPIDLSEQVEQSSMAADNGLEVRISSSTNIPDNRRASWSVTDRVRSTDEARGYSTKVNFGPQETIVVDFKNEREPHSISSEVFKSRWLVKDQNSSFDDAPRLSPKLRTAQRQKHETESAFNTHVEPPRVTSICLRYEDRWQPSTTSSPIKPTPIAHNSSEHKNEATTYVSKSFLIADVSEVPKKIEVMPNGDKSWSFSKGKDNPSSKGSDSDSVISLQSLNNKVINILPVKEHSPSPSKFSRHSQSPSRESLFLERSAERNLISNGNVRQSSSSPTCGTRIITSSSNNTKINSTQTPLTPKADKKITYTKSAHKSTAQSNGLSKPKGEDKINLVRKSDIKPSSNEVKLRERKLSTGSSGRDGWLNTPKETPIRRKPEQTTKKTESRREIKSSEKVLRINGVRSGHKRTESPIYQNREIYAERRDSDTESLILEELTKAADQILLAVNGYTDDDSFRASSDDEYRKRRERTSQPLCTISELPNQKTKTNRNSKLTAGVIKSTRSTDLRREYYSSSKNRISKTPSNSSLESSLSQDIKPLLSAEDRSKRRAARLLQRASSRELLFQSVASSSEDIGSGSDTGSLRTKRVYRRPRLQNGKHSGSKHDLSASTSESRSKGRVQRTSASNESLKSQKAKLQSEKKCSRHSKTLTGSSTNEQRSERERRPQKHNSRTQKKKPETSQMEAKGSCLVQE